MEATEVGHCDRLFSLLRFASSLFGMLEHTLIRKFATSFLMKGELRRMPINTCISFWTLTHLEGVARIATLENKLATTQGLLGWVPLCWLRNIFQ